MLENRANLYNKLNNNIEMLKSLKASFFTRGGVI
jgi:hypothetical protein